jgi:hypothetical protein
MKRNPLLIILIFFIFFVPIGKTYSGVGLNEQEIERVRAFKQLIQEVDKKSLQQTIDDLEETGNPLLNLQIKEAMAKTYADIVREQNVTDPEQKEWLYSMVAMNMAYLQFGAMQDASDNGLNSLIRRKLKQYLPTSIFTQPGFHFSPG